VYDSSSEEEDAVPVRTLLSAGDYVHDEEEEEAVVA
jgi:hypothetical protein